MEESDQIVRKIAAWDLTEELDGGFEGDAAGAAIYRQLQAYFKNFYMHFETVSRVSSQLKTVAQDFIQESGQVGQVADFLKKGAETQTGDIQQVVNLVDNYTAKIDAIYEKSQNIISLAHEMEKTNHKVQESVDHLVVNQEKNDEAVQDIFGVIKNLMTKTQKIGEVTALIDRISSEINLLGLNAKIEAVHAGNAGRGFAVVANEIQRLAEESRSAGGNISDTIKSVTDEIGLLEKVAVKSQDAFSTQRDSVADVNIAFQKNSEFIGTYINEQKSFNASIEEIKSEEATLVNSISNVFSSIREVSATAQEISTLTYNQNNSISLLRKLDKDLSAGVSLIEQDSQKIKVPKVAQQKRKIALIFDQDNPFWVPTVNEAKKASGMYNFELSVFAPKSWGVGGLRDQAGYLDKIIEEKFDGLILAPIDDDLIYQKLKILNRNGTKIVFINSKINNIDYISLIQTDGVSAGATAARVVLGTLGNQGEVVVNSWSDIQISAIENRKNGFIKEINRNSGIVVHEVDVNSNPTEKESEDAIKSILQRFPRASMFFLTNCDWGLIVAKYMRKYHPGIQVLTIDFTKEIESAMNEGLINYAIGQRAYSWGSMALGFLDDSFLNRSVQKYIDTGTYEVNQQNINIYRSLLT